LFYQFTREYYLENVKNVLLNDPQGVAHVVELGHLKEFEKVVQGPNTNIMY